MRPYSLHDLLLQKDLPANTIHLFKKILTGGAAGNSHLHTLTEEQKHQLKSIISEWLDIWFSRQIEFQLLYANLSGLNEREAQHEYNRKNIQEYIRKYVMKKHVMPSAASIALALKINVKTVRKHLIESQNNVDGMFEDYSLMARDIMGSLAGVALSDGNVRAAKVYIDSMEKMKKNRAQPTQVQLKNLVITQTMIDSLTSEQQDSIIDVLSGIADAESEEVQTAIEVAEEIIPITEAREETQTGIEAREEIKPVIKTRKKTRRVKEAVEEAKHMTDTGDEMQKAIRAAEEIIPATETPANQFAPVKIGEGGGKLFD